MNIYLSFFCNIDLQNNDFKKYICSEFSVSEDNIMFINESFFDYINKNDKWDDQVELNKTYVSFEKLNRNNSEFFYHIYFEGKDVSVDEQVNILKKISINFNCKCITSDEGVNPFAFIMIDAQGKAYGVFLDIDKLDSENIVYLDGFNIPFLGSFASIEKINFDTIESFFSNYLNTKKQLIEVTQYDSNFYDVDNECLFIEVVKNVNFKKFKYMYYVTDKRINEWKSIKESSEDWVEITKKISLYIEKEICIFHEHFKKIVNIQGGSDSEEYFIYFDGKEYKKVLFKKPKEKW